MDYQQYSELILPIKPDKVSLQDTITKLESLFVETKSLFVRRLGTMHRKMAPSQICNYIFFFNFSKFNRA